MAGCPALPIGISCAPRPGSRRVVEICQRFKVRGHMNRHALSSVLRVALGCAILTAAATGLAALSNPALAQEASPTVEQPARDQPAARPSAEARRAPPGI